MQLRNAAVDKQLRDNKLQSVDVFGDGNCFYRAVLVSLCGDQNNYSTLSKSIANFIGSKQTGTSSADFE